MVQEYIFCRLMRSGLLTEGGSYSADSAGGKLSDVSRELQAIGARLEAMYPNLYQNVSRQVNITVKVFDAVSYDKNLIRPHCMHGVQKMWPLATDIAWVVDLCVCWSQQ